MFCSICQSEIRNEVRTQCDVRLSDIELVTGVHDQGLRAPCTMGRLPTRSGGPLFATLVSPHAGAWMSEISALPGFSNCQSNSMSEGTSPEQVGLQNKASDWSVHSLSSMGNRSHSSSSSSNDDSVLKGLRPSRTGPAAGAVTSNLSVPLAGPVRLRPTCSEPALGTACRPSSQAPKVSQYPRSHSTWGLTIPKVSQFLSSHSTRSLTVPEVSQYLGSHNTQGLTVPELSQYQKSHNT